MMPFGYSDILFIFAFFIVLVGAFKLPSLARSLGVSLKGSKDNKSQKELLNELRRKKKD